MAILQDIAPGTRSPRPVPPAQRFLDYITETSERQVKVEHRTVPYPDWLRVAGDGQYYPLQSWPTFIGAEERRALSRAVVEITRLVKSIPERIFGGDLRRIAAFYSIPHPGIAGLLLEPPNGLAGAVTRSDYTDGRDGFKCLEINSGGIGGWQHRYFESACRSHPLIARFLEREGLEPRYRDPFAELFRHILADNLGKSTIAGGTLNIAVTVPGEYRLVIGDETSSEMTGLFARQLAASGTGLCGSVVFCLAEQLAMRRGQVCLGELPIQALVEMSPFDAPESFVQCFKAGRLSFYNGPINRLLGDKRNLALLSQHAESDLFTAAERDLLAEHLPWSREVGPEYTAFGGERAPLPELLLSHREAFVIKPADGCQGTGVIVGKRTSPDAWRRAVHQAVGAKGWLAQQYVESRPYLYQYGDRGHAVHDVVWGLFCFGDAYGGGFLRMLPRGGGDGVINAARGATEGILFEI
jgi:hypothetical protein